MPENPPRSAAAQPPERAPGRVVLLAGASGLVGGAILQGLLADDSVAAVHSVGRRTLPLRHSKLTQHQVDFEALPALPPLHEVFIALGTTIKAAGSRQAFRAVDFEAVVAVARAARQAGARRLGVVSAMGASTHSRVFYSRVKGEMEEALSALGFETLVIARPSLLAGDREALGQPARFGEKLALGATGWLSPLIPANYRPIDARWVARALLKLVPQSRGRTVLPSAQLLRHGAPSAAHE